jgi:hypothetical protein
VGPGEIERLVSDPRVFLGDVTPTLARDALRAAQVSMSEAVPIAIGSPYWLMEDLGIVMAP